MTPHTLELLEGGEELQILLVQLLGLRGSSGPMLQNWAKAGPSQHLVTIVILFVFIYYVCIYIYTYIHIYIST